ncbi:MAG: YqgE/AlgH family protein [Luteibaculaceae bacterium]
MLNLKPNNLVKPHKGSILLAEPFLADPYFKRAAVFLCEHNEEGSFGFVINRFLDFNFDQIIKSKTFKHYPVGLGGPVQKENLFYLHSFGESVEGSVQITDDIYFGGDFESLKKNYKFLGEPKNKIRFFVGYSGWSETQLEAELEEDSWLICDNYTPQDIFSGNFDALWYNLVKSFGKEYSLWLNAPQDPILN